MTPKYSLDPRRLLVFREVARAGSLAGAARALGWSQPAVSQHVKRLERDVGTPLVVRAARGVALTEAGARLLHHADAIADRLTAAEQDVAALSGLLAGQVRLAAFPTAAAVLVPPALAEVLATSPRLDVRFTEHEPPEAERAVRDGDADLAIVFRHTGDATPVEGDLLREPLTRHPVLAVLAVDPDPPVRTPRLAGADTPTRGFTEPDSRVRVPRFAGPASPTRVRTSRESGSADHRVAVTADRDAPVLDLADLAGEPWIAGCPRCRAHLLRCAAARGFVPDIRFATDDHVVVQRLVARGLGVALLPEWALEASTQDGVRAVPVTGVDERVVEVLLRPDARRVPAVAAVLAALRSAARRSGRG